MARGRMPAHNSSSVSTIATSIIRFDWLKWTARPTSPSAGCSSNWLSVSMLPEAANLSSPNPSPVAPGFVLSWREHAPDVQNPGRGPQRHEQDQEHRPGAQQSVNAVTDGAGQHQGNDQFQPDPQPDRQRG